MLSSVGNFYTHMMAHNLGDLDSLIKTILAVEGSLKAECNTSIFQAEGEKQITLQTSKPLFLTNQS